MISEIAYYGDTKLSDLGIYLVRTDSGLIKEPFLAERELISEQITGNPIPYVYDSSYKPLKVDLVFATIDDLWTYDKRREFARILDNGKFNPFYTEEDEDYQRIYYLTYIGGIDLQTNGLKQGYVTASFQNISPYSYSPVYTETFELSTIVSPTIIELKNLGDTPLKPELTITKYGAGDLSIVNLSDGGKEFKFTALLDQEQLTVDNDDHIIDTGSDDSLRYDAFNGNYLSLPIYSVSRLQVTGACTLEFKMQYQFKG